MGRFRLSIAGLMWLVVAVFVGLVTLRFASESLAGAVLLLTLFVLGLAILGVAYRRGSRRAFWLGFALVGWGYMVLASGYWWDRQTVRPKLVTTTVLDRLYPFFQPVPSEERAPSLLDIVKGDPDPRNLTIQKKLDMPIAMSFANSPSLLHMLKYLKGATQAPGDSGIPIYVDPAGLREVEKSMDARIFLDVEGVPLRTSLDLALRQLGLTYVVRGGMLKITAITEGNTDPFYQIGHDYWALLAACLGGMAGRAFHASRGVRPTVSGHS